MNTSILLKDGLIIDPATQTESTSDISIIEGVIVDIGDSLKANEHQQVVDASGLWICPGFIDLHTHLRDFGQSDREDIESGTMAAASGGFTTVLAMANTDPPIDNTAILSVLLKKIEEHACIEVLPVTCVTRQMAGAELTDMVALSAMGAVAFSDDGMPITNLAVLRRALEYARLADRIIISHAEDHDLAGSGVIHESLTSTRLGLPGYPAAAETAAIAREIEVVRQTGGRLHFAHVSCAASVELIRAAHRAGLQITADVTPHHLCLSVEDIIEFDTAYKMNPPLRTPADIKSLVEGLCDGTIAAIATDHAPHTRLDKSKPFDAAPFGVIGLETALPLTMEILIGKSKMSKSDFISLLTTKPAAILGLPQPSIKAGNDATLSIIDPSMRWTYDSASGFSRSHNSPFNGRVLTGKNVLTLYRGNLVYKEKNSMSDRSKAVAGTSE